MQDILPIYRKVIGLSSEARVNDKCTQKVECIHKGYNEHMLLVSEHMERSGRKKKRKRVYEYEIMSAILNSASQC